MNNKTVSLVLRPGGSTATRSLVCKECGCRGMNLVRFSDDSSGYACKWNGHPVYTFTY